MKQGEAKRYISSETVVAQPLKKRKNLFSRLGWQAKLGAVIIVAFALIAIFAPVIATHDPTEIIMRRNFQPPCSEHIFGTDDMGRDIFSRVIFGTRISLTVGILATFFGASVGIFVGIMSGYYGKRVDATIMRIIDIVMAFPGMLLAIVIVSILGASTETLIIALIISMIPSYARIVRGSTLTVRKLEYIDAIRAIGAPDRRIIFRHVLPNVLAPIVVQATLTVATSIVAASALSFLGLGTQPPIPEWGNMLSSGREFLWRAPHMMYFPGLAIFLVVLGFNLFGDGLRDALEPKQQAKN